MPGCGRALGPFWGFQEAWLSLAASIFDMAIYPTLFVTYLEHFSNWGPILAVGHRELLIELAGRHHRHGVEPARGSRGGRRLGRDVARGAGTFRSFCSGRLVWRGIAHRSRDTGAARAGTLI